MVEPWWAHPKTTLDIDPSMIVLDQDRHWDWGLTHRRVIKEETLAFSPTWFIARHNIHGMAYS